MTDANMIQCAFRFPSDLLSRVDAFAARMSEQHAGLEYTRADAVRVLLSRALDESDRHRKPKPKAKPSKAAKKRRAA